MSYEAVIGLEVHIQLSTHSKMFSSVSADYFGGAANSFTDPFTLGLPGVLPVINRRAVESAMMFGLALNCDVSGFTQFHRKNYFYPDSPHNFQISQYDRPIARDGSIEVLGKKVRIKRAHLENDAGKLIHPADKNYSLVDLNRAGCALIEMVTEPDIVNAEHARAFLQKIQAIVQALGIGDAKPEEGKMRCDVNVSVRLAGAPFGTKVEVKNLNSFRSVARSLDYEIDRQIKIVRGGGKITQDTMGWDDERGRTFLMRTKEGEADYRYFPEPDLPPLEIDAAWIANVRQKMPKLPDQKMLEYTQAGLRPADAELIAYSTANSKMFEAVRGLYKGEVQKIANWLNADIAGYLGARGLEPGESKLEPKHLAALLALIDAGTISGRIAKDILPEVMNGADPEVLVRERGLLQVSDSSAIEATVQQVVAANPDVLAQIQSGNAKAINALFGKVMKEMGGKANPELVRSLLEQAVKS
ncbi:MAG: Asp-tRNA(Asn)/Glu-tRNA(Gln) amidotransferase subunit GatB [Deinococcales bacterium]